MFPKPTITTPDTGYKDLKIIDEVLRRCNVCKTGRIISFNSENCTCSVQILSKKKIYNGYADYPLLTDVPMVIDGTLSSYLTHGDPTGTNCLVIFNDNEIDKWWTTGESYLPSSNRKHNLTDGFVIMRPISQAAGFVYDVLNTVLARGSNQLILSDESATIKSESASISVSDLIEIKNSQQSLAPIMQALLTACEGISTITGGSLTPSSLQAFTQVKTQLTQLLK